MKRPEAYPWKTGARMWQEVDSIMLHPENKKKAVHKRFLKKWKMSQERTSLMFQEQRILIANTSNPGI